MKRVLFVVVLIVLFGSIFIPEPETIDWVSLSPPARQEEEEWAPETSIPGKFDPVQEAPFWATATPQP